MDLRAKIKKLEALARNNPNRYEAELAAAKAREMGRELDEWDKWSALWSSIFLGGKAVAKE